jgi:hypothetical protein
MQSSIFIPKTATVKVYSDELTRTIIPAVLTFSISARLSLNSPNRPGFKDLIQMPVLQAQALYSSPSFEKQSYQPILNETFRSYLA